MRHHEATRHNAQWCEPTAALRSDIVPPATDNDDADDANRTREEELGRHLQDMNIAAEFVFQRRHVLHRMHSGGGAGKLEGTARQELIDLEDNLAHKVCQYIRVSNVTALYFLNDRQYSRALQILLAAGAAAEKGAGKCFSLLHRAESAPRVTDFSKDTAAGVACGINRSQQDQYEEDDKNGGEQKVFIAYFAERHERKRCCALAIVENNIGLYHFKIAEYDLAERRMSRALEVEELLDVDTIGVTFFNLAQTQYELGRAELALSTITRAEEAVEKSVHDAQMERSRLHRIAQQSQSQSPSHQTGRDAPGLEQRLVQSYLRWRDGVCLLARVFEFHGDWLQLNGAFKAAMRRYEQSERWLSGLRGRGPAEMARRRKLRERIEHCRRCQRRRDCCARAAPATSATSAISATRAQGPPQRARSAIVTTTLPRSVEIVDEAAVPERGRAKPMRSPTPASVGPRSRHCDPLAGNFARPRVSSSLSSHSQRPCTRPTVATRKAKKDSGEAKEMRPPPFCRPPASSLAGTGSSQIWHPQHIWQRDTKKETEAVRVVSLQQCIAVLQAFARAKIASLRAVQQQQQNCASLLRLSPSQSIPSLLSSFSAVPGVTSSRSACSSSVVGPGAKLATALSFNSAVRMRHFRRYQPREVILAFLIAARSVQLVRRWVHCALRMLSSAPLLPHGASATFCTQSTSNGVVVEGPPSTKDEVLQNAALSPEQMKRRYSSVLRVWPRGENASSMPKYVPTEVALRAAAEAAATGPSAPRMRISDSINACQKTEDSNHISAPANEPSSRVTYMTGPEVYSNVSLLPAYRYLDMHASECLDVNGRGENGTRDEDSSLGHSRKPYASFHKKCTPNWSVAHGEKRSPMRGLALREVAAVIIQRAWRSRVQDLHSSHNGRKNDFATDYQKPGTLYRV